MRLAKEEIRDLIEKKDFVKLKAVKNIFIWVGKGKEEGKYAVVIKEGIKPFRTETSDKSQVADLVYEYFKDANSIEEVKDVAG
jgi:hypothetical protein